MSSGMSADTTRFSAPNPPLATLQAQIVKVEDANKQARAHVHGAVRVRNLERNRLVSMLETECAYVKTLCDASPEEASLIIQAAGLASAAFPTYEKPLLKVVRGAAPGTVKLAAAVSLLMGGRNRKSRFFNWQWTTDGGQTFHDAPSTSTSKTMIANLTPLTTVGFRVKITTAMGPGEWSPSVSILVH
jgi:hypothetical protein